MTPASPAPKAAELRPLLLSTALFFLLLCGYYLLRPAREVFGIEAGPHYEWLWTGTALLALVATPIFGLLVSRFPRRVFVPLVYGGAVLCLLVFHQAHARAPAGSELRLGIGYAFYIFVSTLAVFATAVFWGLMVDGWSDGQARRLFGIVAAGGTLGALAGSWLAGALVALPGVVPRDLILVSAGCYAAAAVLARLGMGSLRPEAAVGAERWAHPGLRAAVDGLRLFGSSPYLLLIGVFLAGQTFAGTFLYLESRAFVGEMFPTEGVAAATLTANRAARAGFFADVDVAYNALALCVQLFLVGRLVRWIGVGAMLASLPLVNVAGFGMLALAPSLLAYGAFEVAQRGARFAVMKPAREMLFTVLGRDEKYKAKQFLDTAVYRGTDAGWAWLDVGLRNLLGPLVLKLCVLIPVCAAWGGVGLALGNHNARRRAGARPHRAGDVPDAPRPGSE